MRIIGGRDYYDTALGYGHDEHTTYVRGQEEVSESAAHGLGIEPAGLVMELRPAEAKRVKRFLRWDPWWRTSSETTLRGVRYQLNCTTVIACGKRWQGVRVGVSPPDGSRHEVLYFWSRPRLEAWTAEHGLRIDPVRSEDEIDACFEPAALPAAVQNALVDRRWTILVHDPAGGEHGLAHAPWKVDQPVLKDVEFYRAVPPNEMFQEIDMWVGGHLPAAGREMVQIPDEIRLAKHGMDKTSFRKPKSKR